jgi:predicted nucleic acid-binding protein
VGLTVLDAGVVIAYLDGTDAHHQSAIAELRRADDDNDQLLVPASALAEALVGPSRLGREAVGVVRRLLDRLPIRVVDLDGDIAEAAASIRAQHRSVKLPDALVIATARHVAADRLVTTDRRWPPASELGLRSTIVEL